MFKLKSLTWDCSANCFPANYGHPHMHLDEFLMWCRHTKYIHVQAFVFLASCFREWQMKWNISLLPSFTSSHMFSSLASHWDDGRGYILLWLNVCVDYMHVHKADNIEIFTWSFIKIRRFLLWTEIDRHWKEETKEKWWLRNELKPH